MIEKNPGLLNSITISFSDREIHLRDKILSVLHEIQYWDFTIIESELFRILDELFEYDYSGLGSVLQKNSYSFEDFYELYLLWCKRLNKNPSSNMYSESIGKKQVDKKVNKKEDHNKRYGIGSFGLHEAGHMASFLSDSVWDYLLEHPSLDYVDGAKDLAMNAFDNLFDLYQLLMVENNSSDNRNT